MDIFRQLTRGVHFNTQRFREDAKKFGLVKDQNKRNIEDTFQAEDLPIEDIDTNSLDSPATASNSPQNPEVETESETETAELTLLGDIKVKKPKKAVRKEKFTPKEKLRKLHRERINHFRKVQKINARGTDLPDPINSWSKLKEKYALDDELLTAITKRYKDCPTPIQMQAIPFLLDRRQVLACAPTGSGKTAAYLVPLLHFLSASKEKRKTRAVILAPTRELAMQIQREVAALGENLKVRSMVLDSKLEAVEGRKKVKHADITVSTPNRMVYLLKEYPEYLSSAQFLIVDESDKLFEAGPKGFRDQLAAVYRACPTSVQWAMFSATLVPEVEQWCKLNLDNLVSVTIGVRNLATTQVKQELVYTGTEKGKLIAFKDLVDRGLKPPVLVFVQSKERAKDLFNELQSSTYGGLKVDVIHSERSQLQRDTTIRKFRAGNVWVLICTELLGRGIDFKGVNLVVNYDFPPSTISYIHRIGRTGRAGRSGSAVTFFTDADKTLLRSVATLVKSSGGDVPDYMLKLKKASRQEKRQIAKTAVAREDIREESKYDKEKRVKREQMIEGSKRRKRKMEEEEKTPAEDSGELVKKHKTDSSKSAFVAKKEKKKSKQKKGHNKD